MEPQTKLDTIVGMVRAYGSVDGEDHKQWVLDQVVRIALGEKYNKWVENYCYDNDAYKWDTGIAP